MATLPKSLEKVRESIDDIDDQLLELLSRRAVLSVQAGGLKRAQSSPTQVYRPDREAHILKRLYNKNTGLPKEHVQAVFREIFSTSRALQTNQYLCFQGPEGSADHLAGMRLLGSATAYRPVRNLADCFRQVQEGQSSLAIVPVEDASSGYFGRTIDFFSMYQVNIQAEIFTRTIQGQDNWTRHVIIGKGLTNGPGADKTSILFFVKDKENSLPNLLQALSEAGINLSHFQSRPQMGQSRMHLFFADLPCNILEPQYAEALHKARQASTELRILGIYPAGTL